MALVVFNARFIKSDERNIIQNTESGMKYGATRTGAEIYPSQSENMGTGDYLNYIATRQGSEKYEGEPDGLFCANGKSNLKEEEAKLDAHPNSLEWRAVLSLTKEDANRVGLYTAKDWQSVLCRVMPKIATQFNISPQNLVWNAAFHPIDKHGSDHHPHVHIYFYSTDEEEGVAGDEVHTKRAFRRCRSIFTNDIFREDMEPYKTEKTTSKEELRNLVKEFAQRAPTDLLDGVIKSLPEKGKMQYGDKYMPKATKLEVDKVVKQICNTAGVRESFEHLRNVVRQQAEHYYKDPSDVEAEMAEWEKDFFHPEGRNTYEYRVLHNAVLREASYRAKKSDGKELAKEFLKELPPLAKKKMLKDISLSAEANKQNENFKKVFAGFKDATKNEIINRITSEAVYEAGNDIYNILKEDTELLDKLISETRLDIPMHPSELDDNCQADLLSQEASDSCLYYIKVITHDRNPDELALNKLQTRFLDVALTRRAYNLVAKYSEEIDYKPLQELLGCKRIYPKDLNDKEISVCSKIATAISQQCQEISGSIASGNSYKVINAILKEAYNRELSGRISQLYSDIPQQIGVYRSISKTPDFKCCHNYDELSPQLQSSVSKIADKYCADCDQSAVKRIRDTVCNILSAERIKNIIFNNTVMRNSVNSTTAPIREFCNACNIEQYNDLPSDKQQEFLSSMRKIFINHSDITDYIDSNSDKAGSALFHSCRSVADVHAHHSNLANIAHSQILGMLSASLLFFRSGMNQPNTQQQKQQQEQKTRKKKRLTEKKENQSQETEIEF